MGQKFFIGIKKEIKMNRTESRRGLRIVLLSIMGMAFVSFFLWLDWYSGTNTKVAMADSERLMGTITYLGELPWNVEEYPLRAIIVCDGQKTFVRDNSKFGTAIVGCGYFLSQGVKIEYSANWMTGEGKVYFPKISISTE